MGMSRIFIHGLGAVSPAGWGRAALCEAVRRNSPIPTQALERPGWNKRLKVRRVPPPAARPAFLAHSRLRRVSAISHYVLAAALEALGDDTTRVQEGSLRLGIVLCVMTGCVSYSRRFFEETLQDPATASPLLFPETVLNAPASHLGAYLGSTGINYTLVGDNGAFLQGLALATDWLLNDRADGCVVIGAEEMDWILADAMRLFVRQAVYSDGAGALYLRKQDATDNLAELAGITDSHPYVQHIDPGPAARRMRAQLPAAQRDELLCQSAGTSAGVDRAEESAWSDWAGPRCAPAVTLGEAFTASAAWQCVVACDAVQRSQYRAANVSVVGANQQAIGARFICL